MKYIFYIILLFFPLEKGIPQSVYNAGELKASISNGQVYLSWNFSNATGSLWRVLRSQTKGGYYSIIAEKLEDEQWVDTPPESDRPFYYVAIRYDTSTGNEEARTKEVRVYLP